MLKIRNIGEGLSCYFAVYRLKFLRGACGIAYAYAYAYVYAYAYAYAL